MWIEKCDTCSFALRSPARKHRIGFSAELFRLKCDIGANKFSDGLINAELFIFPQYFNCVLYWEAGAGTVLSESFDSHLSISLKPIRSTSISTLSTTIGKKRKNRLLGKDNFPIKFGTKERREEEKLACNPSSSPSRMADTVSAMKRRCRIYGNIDFQNHLLKWKGSSYVSGGK